ncbi:MAG: VWA domain-containing protein, partial [Anaerolineae bacterium]|nr:VWA domain-containing protein [Anaerolineae bacterium]
MSFLAPLAALLALLAIPIVLLYMLRLRRQETEVSSTYLWRQLLQDREANAPWQKLRRNLLLLLQLLVLALLIFALMRPFIEIPTVTTGRIVLLLDASASMNATDVPPSRFAAAQQAALELAAALSAQDSMTVIRVADVPEVLASATNDLNLLRSAILNAEVSQASADWQAALTLAAGGAVGVEQFSVVLISDGGLPLDLPTLPGEIRYIPVGISDENVAITAMAARARAGETPQVFVELTNFGGTPAQVILSLELDDRLDRAQRFTIPARSVREVFYTDLTGDFTTLSAGLTRATGSTVPNHLTLDDRGWTVFNPPGAGRVLLMTPGNIYLRQALTSLPGIEPFQGQIENGLPTGQSFDLYVLDGWLPEDGTLPPGDLLIVNPPRSSALFSVAGRSRATDSPRVAPDDGRTRYVNFNNVSILDFTLLEGADWADPLVTVSGGPLLLAGTVGGRQVAILTFDLHRSDLPLQITWPILLANLMEWYTPARTVQAADGLLVGDTLALSPAFEADRVRITRPDGETTTIRVGEDPLMYTGTTLPGLYAVETYAGSELLQTEAFAVNLFDRRESLIAPVEQLRIGASQVSEAAREEIGQREFWPLIALGALALLLLEWWLYHRQQHIPSPQEIWA